MVHQFYWGVRIVQIFKVLLCIADVEIPDDGSGDPYDFKFIRWMTKNKVSYYLVSLLHIAKTTLKMTIAV